jgi:hypothetical protein
MLITAAALYCVLTHAPDQNNGKEGAWVGTARLRIQTFYYSGLETVCFRHTPIERALAALQVGRPLPAEFGSMSVTLCWMYIASEPARFAPHQLANVMAMLISDQLAEPPTLTRHQERRRRIRELLEVPGADPHIFNFADNNNMCTIDGSRYDEEFARWATAFRVLDDPAPWQAGGRLLGAPGYSKTYHRSLLVAAVGVVFIHAGASMAHSHAEQVKLAGYDPPGLEQYLRANLEEALRP